ALSLMRRRPPRSPPLPYTTLFRSHPVAGERVGEELLNAQAQRVDDRSLAFVIGQLVAIEASAQLEALDRLIGDEKILSREAHPFALHRRAGGELAPGRRADRERAD